MRLTIWQTCRGTGRLARRLVLILCVCLVPSSWLVGDRPVRAQSFWEGFVDPLDGTFDVSNWLLRQKGFFPVPTFITEPAVGFGGGGALLLFHEAKTAATPGDMEPMIAKASEHAARVVPPSISGAFGLGTENGTWAAGGFHVGYWQQDRIRYVGGAAVPSVNLTFYGGGDSPIFGNGIDYNLEGWLLLQELTFRVDDSDIFVGGRFVYSGTRSEFDLSGAIPGIESWELDFDSVGLGFVTRYDSRDNNFTPNRGVYAGLTSTLFNTSGILGGRSEYMITDAKNTVFWPINDDLVLGWRLGGRFSAGNVPFFALPSVDLRGIPAMRYQGSHTLMTEAELRWDLTKRWSVVGFGGVGTAVSSLGDLDEAPARWAGGLGFRYLTARAMGLYTGLDLAFGPEETAVYIQFGHAWAR
jgi:hypothetical protein